MADTTKRHNQNLGRDGESRATEYLVGLGYSVIARNWRSRSGEIDIIAQKGKILYLVEVKTRSSAQFGFPHDAITPQKLQRMQITAQIYAQQTHYFGEMKLILIEILGKKCSITELE
jgi:putative endonuclease